MKTTTELVKTLNDNGLCNFSNLIIKGWDSTIRISEAESKLMFPIMGLMYDPSAILICEDENGEYIIFKDSEAKTDLRVAIKEYFGF